MKQGEKALVGVMRGTKDFWLPNIKSTFLHDGCADLNARPDLKKLLAYTCVEDSAVCKYPATQ